MSVRNPTLNFMKSRTLSKRMSMVNDVDGDQKEKSIALSNNQSSGENQSNQGEDDKNNISSGKIKSRK